MRPAVIQARNGLFVITFSLCFNLLAGTTVLVEDAFDGASGATPNAAKFEWGGQVGLNGAGQLNLSTTTANTSWIKSKTGATPASDGALVAKFTAYAYAENWNPGVYGDKQPRGLRSGTDANNAVEFYSLSRTLVGLRARRNGAETLGSFSVPAGVDSMREYQISVTATAAVFRVDGALAGTITSNIPTNSLNLYICTYDGNAGNVPVTVDYAQLSLTNSGIAPSITAQPVSVTNLAGTTASFSVTAGGTAPLSYQWWFNGNPLANRTNSSLAINNAQLSDGGAYQVIVTNTYGSATSQIAALTVVLPSPPAISSVSPTNGFAGTVIAISGTSFTTACGVTLNGAALPFSVVSDTQITATVIAGATSGLIAVINQAGTATSLASFEVWSPAADFIYSQNNGSIAITRYVGSGGNVVIPTFINGFPVTQIGLEAFWGDESLSAVWIPIGVTNIGDRAFCNCTALTNLSVNALNSNYCSLDGVLFNKDKTLLIQYPAGKSGSYAVPYRVAGIGDYAFFNCAGLSGVTIPNTVTNLGDSAFYACANLTTVYFQGNAPSLGGPDVFVEAGSATVYYLPGTADWGSTYGGRPTAPWPWPLPVIETFSPTMGPIGTVVTIHGSNLLTVSGVTLGGGNIPFSLVSDSQLRATLPPAAVSGFLRVTNSAGSGTSSTFFQIIRPVVVLTNADEAALSQVLANGGTAVFDFDGVVNITTSNLISDDVLLDGSGHHVTLDGGNLVRLLSVNPGGRLTLRNLTLANGNDQRGAAIYNNGGSVTATDCVFTNNIASSTNSGSPAFGGALYNGMNGTLRLTSCSFLSNCAIGQTGAVGASNGGTGGMGGNAYGGAIYTTFSTVLMTNCTFHGNQARGGTGGTGGHGVDGYQYYHSVPWPGTGYWVTVPGGPGGRGGDGGHAYGGSIYFSQGASAVVNATIAAGNVFGGSGGNPGSSGAYWDGQGYRGAGGSGTGSGGNLAVSGALLALQNSILASPGGAVNTLGFVGDGGNNICSDSSCAFTNSTSFNNANPQLAGAPADNGGPTPTIALQYSSPARNAGNDSVAPATDQRHLPRLNQSDIGAYEIQVAAPFLSAQPTNQTVIAGFAATFAVAATGTAPLAYQWFYNDIPVPGATNSSLTVTNVDCANQGNYCVAVTNAYGCVTSSVAALNISNRAPSANSGGPYTILYGNQLTLNGSTSSDADAGCGDSVVSYEWDLNLDGVADGIGVSPVFSHATLYGLFSAGMAGTHSIRLTVTDSRGATAQTTTTLTILQTFYRDLDGDGWGVLSISSNAITRPIGYAVVWGDCDDTRASVHPGATEIGNGIDDDCDGATDEGVNAPFIIVQPVGRVIMAGSNVSFTVTDGGASPRFYQWRFNGTNMPGATNISLTVSTATAANQGEYQLVITNTFGSVASAITILSVIMPPLPVITSFSPANGAAGTVITINGTNLFTTTSVKLNGAPLPFSVVSDLQITATVSPTATSGLIVVENLSGAGTAQGVFQVWPPVPDFTFVTNNGTITITGYTGSSNIVTIPSMINGLPVTAVGGFLFRTAVVEINMPNTITSIEDYAFSHCYGLTNVNIPESVTNIGIFAFTWCLGLTNVVIPDSVIRIGNDAFYYCTSLTTVTVGNGVRDFGSEMFHSCGSLKEVYFRGNAPSGGAMAFRFAGDAIVYYLPGTTGWVSTFSEHPTLLWRPRLLTGDPNFGVRANQFGFNVKWAIGRPVVVEGCTNPANPTWLPLTTNALGGEFYFKDPQWTSYPGRFYRLRAP